MAIYAKEKEKYRKNPYYFLEVYAYFSSHWGNKGQSDKLFRYIVDNFEQDISALKALAYIQQENGHYESALLSYAKILKVQYGVAQAHRDVANTYAELGRFESALAVYTHYATEVCQSPHAPFDAFGNDVLMTTEMMTLLDQNKAFLSDHYDLAKTTDSKDSLTRVVFEWNAPAATFDIQLSGPNGHYDTWESPKSKDASSNAAAATGYDSQQFFIDQAIKGSWQVNIDYQGNQSEMPTYLKVSVYKNYGLASQTIEIQVYRLSPIHQKVQLLVLQNT